MLILTRRVGQTISIGDDIEITVMAFVKGAVKIGINAPKEIQILRDDAKVKHENPDNKRGA